MERVLKLTLLSETGEKIEARRVVAPYEETCALLGGVLAPIFLSSLNISAERP